MSNELAMVCVVCVTVLGLAFLKSKVSISSSYNSKSRDKSFDVKIDIKDSKDEK